jgi:death-on-curing protein
LAEGEAASIRYVSLAEYLLIAEVVTGTNASVLARSDRVGLAESALAAPSAAFDGLEAYPRFVDKAAVLVVHLCRNHPLVDGNKRAAFLSLLEFVQSNGRRWLPSAADPNETEQMIVAIAAGEASVVEVALWLERRVSRSDGA